MRKMTYQQAATCGENLKVRVTPEQSEKLQKAWFAAGKTWGNGSTSLDPCCYLFLHRDWMLKYDCDESDDYFYNHKNEEIKLIDDLPQHDFASQQEVWQWAVQGNKVEGISDGKVYGFKDGEMFLYSNNMPAMPNDFSKYWNWKKHTPPRLIRVNGVEVPAPLESLDGRVDFWLIEIYANVKAVRVLIKAHRSEDIEDFLNQGLCYATKEDAIARAEAMLKFEVIK